MNNTKTHALKWNLITSMQTNNYLSYSAKQWIHRVHHHQEEEEREKTNQT